MGRTLRWWLGAVVLSVVTPFLLLVQVQQTPRTYHDIDMFLTQHPAINEKKKQESITIIIATVSTRQVLNNTGTKHTSHVSSSINLTSEQVLNFEIASSKRHFSITSASVHNSTAKVASSPTVQAEPCRDRYVTKHVRTEATSDPKRQRILFMDGVGRLGNKMFQYAALIGLAKRHGFKPLVNDKDLIAKVFQISHTTSLKYSNFPVYFEKAAAVYDPCLETMRHDWDWRLGGYYQSWKYFTNVEDKIRKEFTFKSNTRKEVNKTIAEIEARFKGQTKVGVHIRRGDMSISPSKLKGYTMGDKGYFLKAMDHFRKSLQNPVFVILSDDIKWCKNEFKSEKDVVFFHRSRGFDLATLASCDHSIISTGSYGWWGAWLAGGRTVYYKNFPRNGSWLATQYRADDYFPPSWIGMV